MKQPEALLPYWGSQRYWTHLHTAPEIDRDLNIPYRSFSCYDINRCKIYSPQTGSMLLSIPILGGRKTKSMLKETQIDYSTDWMRTHFKHIRQCYSSCLFWQEVAQEKLAALYHPNNHISYLLDWNKSIIEWLLHYIDIAAIFPKVKKNSLVTQAFPCKIPLKKKERGGEVFELSILHYLMHFY